MATTVAIPQTNLPVGTFETAPRISPVAFSLLRLDATFSAFPLTATFSFSQWVSLDAGVTWNAFGAATVGDGVNGLRDKAGNPTLNWPFVAGVLAVDPATGQPSGTPTVPQGAMFKVRFVSPQPLTIASGLLTLT